MRRPAFVVLVLLASSVARAADPAKPGKFPVGVVTVDAVDTDRARTIPTEIWYPADGDGGRDAAPLPRGFPLVIVQHGLCGSRTNYEYLTAHLASHGFVVAAPDVLGFTAETCHAGGVPVDAIAQDDDYVCRTLHDVVGPLAKWAQHVYGQQTGIVGHSLGGFGAAEAAKLDEAFLALVLLAPAVNPDEAADLAALPLRRAVMVLGGTNDVLLPFATVMQPFFDGLRKPSFLVRLTDGTHGGFTDVDGTLTPEALVAQETATKRYATAFLYRYLARRTKFRRWLKKFDDGAVAVTPRVR